MIAGQSGSVELPRRGRLLDYPSPIGTFPAILACVDGRNGWLLDMNRNVRGRDSEEGLGTVGECGGVDDADTERHAVRATVGMIWSTGGCASTDAS